MVVRIRTGKSIGKALSYNEHKIQQGDAKLILASGFSCDVDKLGFTEKLRRFEHLIQRNEKVNTNAVHLVLAFPPEEKLDTFTLQRIAMDYMDRIGFGGQPFLVYQHDDTGNRHIHIVTTSIRPNGTAINLHNLGREASDPARKAIEEEYGLIRAAGRNNTLNEYQPTKKLSWIAAHVTSQYRFTNLDELNAILHQFGVTADPGAEGSLQARNKGLIFSRVDEAGNKIGVTIKASKVYGRPTLHNLEKKYEHNQVKKQLLAFITQNALEKAIVHGRTPEELLSRLDNSGLELSFRQPEREGEPQIYIVDHRRKTVYAAADLNLSIEQHQALAQLILRESPTNQELRQQTARWYRQRPVSKATAGFAVSLVKSMFASPTDATSYGGPLPVRKKKKRKRPPL
ncbi:relaxase/mobilization nuclease domain-containing protein [Dinghuibacter silviterrae]|uniref:Relaxase/mobilization nuclease-like protein n=1 Tax=Dinghuibacter silviterrae TaxID=1539049 RepID=A0A4R8DJ87_9BACT|nr:relaxase/mobilization nuclease domain-containing protein [Dinghuibacter silviterrae]TDW97070.1 relaxase/mobilization nuclease-like protein [Dinghuibacter silviterrae]